MAYTENPCRYCTPPKRHPKCHGTCKEHKEWREKNIEPFKADEATAFLINTIEKQKKKKKKR